VRILPNPSVDLLSSSFLNIPVARGVYDSPVSSAGRTQGKPLCYGDSSSSSAEGEGEMKKFIVLRVRNGSRQIAAISTSQSAAIDALTSHIMSSRDQLKDHPLHSPTESPQRQSQKNADSRNPEPFLEFLEPESTKNLIFPLELWRSKIQESVRSPSGLFWALYDPFGSSLSERGADAMDGVSSAVDAVSMHSTFRGNIRCGVVLGVPPSDCSASATIPSSVADSSPQLQAPRVSNMAKQLSASVLLYQKGVLVFENSYTVNTKNNFKCQLWEFYDLHLKINCLPPPLSLPTAAELALPHSDPSTYEVTLSVQLVESNSDNTLENRDNEKISTALIDGKTQFSVSGRALNGKARTEDRITTIEKLRVCFPEPGTFSVNLLYRCLGGKEDDRSYPISTIFFQVQ
jgi:hypothetical protein